VAALGAQVLDVRADSFGDPEPVEGQQGDQGVLGGGAEPGRDEKSADLVAVQAYGVRLVVQPRPPDVRRRGVCQQIFFDRVPVQSGDGGQAARDGGPGPAL
jgi:hypothetical protein